MSTVRLRRLTADFAKLDEYVRRHPRLRMVQQHGDPPERYQIEYQIRCVRMVGGEVQPERTHLVEITLPLHYPRLPPQCRMLSPVFHPNIAPHAICIGDHWTAGESLQGIVMRIGEMLAYQSYNVKSPLNGEAARWVQENGDRLPLDDVSMLIEEDTSRRNGAAQATGHDGLVPNEPPAAAPTAPSPLTVSCPQCDKAYRLPAEFAGRKVRCSGCQEVFEVH